MRWMDNNNTNPVVGVEEGHSRVMVHDIHECLLINLHELEPNTHSIQKGRNTAFFIPLFLVS